MVEDRDDAKPPGRSIQIRPRERSLSQALLARVFHQPSLVYFIAVAEHLSFREAGRRLNVASSAVTRQVAALEDALGMELFHRDARPLKLAPAGEILFQHARRVTGHLEAAVSELELLRGLKTGSVRIATVESVGLSLIPKLIATFGTLYPGLHIDVSVTSSTNVIERLMDERADIGFGFASGPPGRLDVAVRRDVPIGVLMRPDHPLASLDQLMIADCLRHKVALAKPEISIREIIEPFLQRIHLAHLPFVEVDSIRMLVELAQIGHHVSIMTPIGAQAELEDGRLSFRALDDPGLPINRFCILTRAGRVLHFAPAVFFEYSRAAFESVDFMKIVGSRSL